jgi:uncharacterized membrane protein YbaN (DUF454 family)
MTHGLMVINRSIAPVQERRTFRQTVWLVVGFLCIATGIVGIVVPLLPTTDFVLLAAFCFSKGSRKWESWLLNHRQFGPMVREWRTTRCIPLRVKLWSSTMLLLSAWLSAWMLPSRTAWIPPAVCLMVAMYLWSRPSKAKAEG